MKPLALDLFCGAWPVRMRACRHCATPFGIASRADANRQYCSRKCSRKGIEKSTLAFHQANPNAMNRYNQNRVVKNPGAWREKHRAERGLIFDALGGKCVVCGIANVNWLETDYAPTTRGKPFRHPRHPAFILANLKDFRLLCANHHRELTLTGKIEGTEIIQCRGH